MGYIALCPGEDLPCCANCKRNQANNPRDAADPWQAWIAPVTRGEDCLLWMAGNPNSVSEIPNSASDTCQPRET